MADNLNVTEGSGKTIRAIDVGGVLHQGVVLFDSAGNAISPSGGAVIAQTPTITAGAYHAKDAVGGKLTFANAARISGGKGVINSVTIVDDDNELAGLELWLYNQDFTASSDNAAFDPTDADNENLVGVIPISSADYFSANDNACACVRGVGLEYQCVGGTSLYGQLKCTATPTYTGTGDLTVKIGVEYLD